MSKYNPEFVTVTVNGKEITGFAEGHIVYLENNWDETIRETFTSLQATSPPPLDWNTYTDYDPEFDIQKTVEEIELRDSFNFDE